AFTNAYRFLTGASHNGTQPKCLRRGLVVGPIYRYSPSGRESLCLVLSTAVLQPNRRKSLNLRTHWRIPEVGENRASIIPWTLVNSNGGSSNRSAKQVLSR